MERYKKIKIVFRALSVLVSAVSFAQTRQERLKDRLANIREQHDLKNQEQIEAILEGYTRTKDEEIVTPLQARLKKMRIRQGHYQERKNSQRSPLLNREKHARSPERKYIEEISPIVIARFERNDATGKGLFVGDNVYYKSDWMGDSVKDREIANQIINFYKTLEAAFEKNFTTKREKSYLKDGGFTFHEDLSMPLYERLKNIAEFIKMRLKYYRGLKNPTRQQRNTEAKLRNAHQELNTFAKTYFSYTIPQL